jgi:hypothetical protein
VEVPAYLTLETAAADVYLYHIVVVSQAAGLDVQCLFLNLKSIPAIWVGFRPRENLGRATGKKKIGCGEARTGVI